jgi:hypothetical protein
LRPDEPETLARQAIARALLFSRLEGQFTRCPKPLRSTCLVTSLYDETSSARLTEYLACVVENLNVFERIIALYESTSGTVASIVHAIGDELEAARDRIELRPVPSRPTIGDLFSVRQSMPPGIIVAAANADVAFDASFVKMVHADLSGLVAVLTRHDIAPDGRSARLIRWDNGAPNVLSSDAWIVRTPFDPDFHLDYPVGTFYCDSFINNQIRRSSRYEAINPCFDVRIFHLHDARFNPSSAKQADAQAISRLYEKERDRNGEGNPILGVAWSTLEHARALPPLLRYQGWKQRVLVFELAGMAGPSWATVLLMHCVLCKPLLVEDALVVVRSPPFALGGELAAMMARYQSHFSISGLVLDVQDGGLETAASGPNVVTSKVGLERLAQRLIEKATDRELHGLLWPGAGSGLMRTELTGSLSAETLGKLRALLRQEAGAVAWFRQFFES